MINGWSERMFPDRVNVTFIDIVQNPTGGTREVPRAGPTAVPCDIQELDLDEIKAYAVLGVTATARIIFPVDPAPLKLRDLLGAPDRSMTYTVQGVIRRGRSPIPGSTAAMAYEVPVTGKRAS
jgi:hypothetical protein